MFRFSVAFVVARIRNAAFWSAWFQRLLDGTSFRSRVSQRSCLTSSVYQLGRSLTLVWAISFIRLALPQS